MENGLKNDGFLDGKTFQNYALCNEFMVFALCEKVEKSMQKWFPKWMNIHLKVDLETALGHFFSDFKRFGEWPKKHEFLMLLRWPKNP